MSIPKAVEKWSGDAASKPAEKPPVPQKRSKMVVTVETIVTVTTVCQA